MEKFLDLVQKNGHKLIHFDPNVGTIPAEANHKYMSVFDYSIKYGGTYDSSKYYNNNVVDVTQNN